MIEVAADAASWREGWEDSPRLGTDPNPDHPVDDSFGEQGRPGPAPDTLVYFQRERWKEIITGIQAGKPDKELPDPPFDPSCMRWIRLQD
ncbi:hypothetical protein IRY61_05850 [Candidatus Saccharibacteria bacterium]|nr:hypothetical protein [Candidatus Saccharibacteria bacterium]